MNAQASGDRARRLEQVKQAIRAELYGARIAARVDYRQLADELATAMVGAAMWEAVISSAPDRRAADVKAAERAIRDNAADPALSDARAVTHDALQREGHWRGNGAAPFEDPAVRAATDALRTACDRERPAWEALARERLQEATTAVVELERAVRSSLPPRSDDFTAVHEREKLKRITDWLDATNDVLRDLHEPPRRAPRAAEALGMAVTAAAAVWLRHLGKPPRAGGGSRFPRVVQAAARILYPQHGASPATVRGILRDNALRIQSRAAIEAAPSAKGQSSTLKYRHGLNQKTEGQ